MGVMVPPDKILAEAKRQQVDVIGLSGLITPSLDEMVQVAKEMEREGMRIPLLIGGATTSKLHTAVKIDPAYSGTVVHVLDASRSVPVTSELVNPDSAPRFHAHIKAEYQVLREEHGKKQGARNLIPIGAARENKVSIDWKQSTLTNPTFTGRCLISDVKLKDLVPYIDWTPFFQTWMLAGRFPAILKDEVVGSEATKLYADALKVMDELVKSDALQPRAVVGFWKAQSIGDDVYLTAEDGTPVETLNFLRQQNTKAGGAPNFCLADFISPEQGKDHIGLFAVTAGNGLDVLVEQARKDHDDYREIMLKALADRFAEAFAEYLHEVVRKTLWGYASDESLDNEQRIDEQYSGIRPAPGYPGCPDHTEKKKIFALLNASEAGLQLTESMAMWPASSVSGYYFANASSRYFGLGKIARDQVEDYATRKGMSVEECEKWLAPVLAY
ncbi:MAG: vitamin B12 dependent-methionine synthase activation domain-containing protein, partial [Bacteroidota bacterium]